MCDVNWKWKPLAFLSKKLCLNTAIDTSQRSQLSIYLFATNFTYQLASITGEQAGRDIDPKRSVVIGWATLTVTISCLQSFFGFCWRCVVCFFCFFYFVFFWCNLQWKLSTLHNANISKVMLMNPNIFFWRSTWQHYVHISVWTYCKSISH